MNNIAQKIKNSSDIVGIVQDYGISLKRTGNVLQGLCPFHEEGTPSFTVYPETQSFYCFGCFAGGDIITFVEMVEDISFKEVIEKMSVTGDMKAKLRVTRQQTRPTSYNAPAHSITNEDIAIYEDCYRRSRSTILNNADGREVTDYLISRGFKKEHIELMDVGAFTPGVRVQLTETHDQEMLKKTGIASYGMGFNYQLVFPQRNMKGEIVGLIARLIRPAPEDVKLPKYKFTSGMKKDIPFNLFNAARNIKSSRDVIVVEGHIDALTLICAGYKNVIATGGAILNEANLDHLEKCGAKNIYLAFDMDIPGREGCKRSLVRMLGSGIVPFVVEIPDRYKDINEYFVAYSEHPSFRDVIEQDLKKSIIGWKWISSYMGRNAAGDRDKNEVIEEAMKNIYPYIPGDIYKNEFLKTFSKAIKIPRKAIEKTYCSKQQRKVTAKKGSINPSDYLEAVNKKVIDGVNLNNIIQFCNSFYRENKGFLSKESVHDFSAIKYFCGKWEIEKLAKFVTQRLKECDRKDDF